MAKSLVEKAFRTWKEEGASVFYDKTKNKIINKIKSISGQETDIAVEIYNAWIAANECDILSVEELTYQPFFSGVIPV